MSGKFKAIDVRVSDLHHDLENVRHPEKSNQKDVIKWMLDEHGKEIYNLAEDILTHGLNPIELPLVVESSDGDGYVVIEGNRRLTALKLLVNPNLAGDVSSVRKFSRLKEKFSTPVPRKIQVVVASSKNDAMWTIDRRHNGRDDGRGVVPWNAQQKARAQRTRNGSAGRYEKALNLIDYAVKNNLLKDDTPRLMESGFPITNLERLLADSSFIQHIGISFDDEKALLFDVKSDAAEQGIARILKDILGGLSVSQIKNADLRKKYAKKIKEDLPGPEDILDNPEKASGVKEPPASGGAGERPKVKRSKRDRKKRAYLIDSSISISEKITNSVYHELRGCDLNSYPMAATCLLRVLIDHSATHYIDKFKISVNTKGGRRATLTEKIKAVFGDLETNGKLSKAHLKKLRAATSGNGGISDPENLHLTLHSQHFIANKIDLIDIWDGTYEALISAIWANIKK